MVPAGDRRIAGRRAAEKEGVPMRVSFSRLMVAAPAALLILVGVASVAFSLGANSGSVPNARGPQSTIVPAPRMTNGPANPRPSGAPGNQRFGQVAPGLVGTVASKTVTAIVVTTTAGKTVMVDVSATTRFVVGGVSNATLANVTVGTRVSVQGTQNADGSFNATVVRAFGVGGRGFRGGPGGGRGFPTPNPSAIPSGPSI
jgi:hypothetical protein